MSRMPSIYREHGVPLRWQDDVTGVLPAAVRAYFSAVPDLPSISPEEVELIRDYCEYYIAAPCWSTEGMEAQFTDLRERVKSLKSASEIDVWIADALKVGIDPF